jgi:hypothetical protein
MKQGATPEKTKIEHSEIRHSLLRPVPDEVEWRTNPKCSTACGLAVALGCDQITKQTQIFAFSHQKQRLPKKLSGAKSAAVKADKAKSKPFIL